MVLKWEFSFCTTKDEKVKLSSFKWLRPIITFLNDSNPKLSSQNTMAQQLHNKLITHFCITSYDHNRQSRKKTVVNVEQTCPHANTKRQLNKKVLLFLQVQVPKMELINKHFCCQHLRKNYENKIKRENVKIFFGTVVTSSA